MSAPVLSTGQPSTLAVWRDLMAELVGDHRKALDYLNRKITEQGADQPVVADESQVLMLLIHMDAR